MPLDIIDGRGDRRRTWHDRHRRGVRHPGQDGLGARVEGIEKSALSLCKFALIGIFLTGFVGYFVVDDLAELLLRAIKDGKNVWLLMQLACMVVYATGVFLAFNGIRRTSHAMA